MALQAASTRPLQALAQPRPSMTYTKLAGGAPLAGQKRKQPVGASATSSSRPRTAAASAAATAATRTCRVCHSQYVEQDNHPAACRYHSANYSGGELSKVRCSGGRWGHAPDTPAASTQSAPSPELVSIYCRVSLEIDVGCAPLPPRPLQAIGFCRASDAPEHSLRAVVGRTGLIR